MCYKTLGIFLKNCFTFSNSIIFLLIQDCKWKMYMEMDEDEIAITYIKDVTFNTNLHLMQRF